MSDQVLEQLTHARLAAAPPEQRAHLVEAFLLATIAGPRPDQAKPADASARLGDLAIDSLQIVELKFELDQVLGVEADIELIIDNPTIRELAVNGVRSVGL
ncbi:acyl carrier protein [Caulobacter segnis]